MDKNKTVSDTEIEKAVGWINNSMTVEEGRLTLVDLLIKANAGYRNSYTEEKFLSRFDLLKKDRTTNRRGARFLCSMMYAPSNRQSEYVRMVQEMRKANVDREEAERS